jgi:hypothetical protein
MRHQTTSSGLVPAAVAAIACGLAALFILTAIAWALADLLGWPVWTGFAAVGALLSLVAVVAVALALRAMNAAPPSQGPDGVHRG